MVERFFALRVQMSEYSRLAAIFYSGKSWKFCYNNSN